MRDCEIRAVMNLKFDYVKEKDIISEVQELTAHRKFGGYVESLIRFAAEHRKEMEALGFNSEMRGNTDTRKEMFNSIYSEIDEMRAKVDAVLNTVLAIKAAFELGKAAGIEKQVDNVIAAQIVLQIQMNKLSSLVGGQLREVDLDKYRDSIDTITENAVNIANERYGELIANLADMYNQVLSLKEQCQIAPVLVSANIASISDSASASVTDIEVVSTDNTALKDASIEDTNKNDSNSSSYHEEVSNVIDNKVNPIASEPAGIASFTDDLDGLAALFGR